MRQSLIAGVFGVLLAAPVVAAEHQVKMLNKGPDGRRNWFEPAIVHAEPGDTIRWLPTHKGHNSASVAVPEGAATWRGKLSQETAVTVEQEGLYLYNCTPHYALGMVGLIVVGEPSVNREALEAVRLPGRAKKVVADLLAEVERGR